MELWTEVRRRVLTGEISRRQACAQYALHWQTLNKILGHIEPLGYRSAKRRRQPSEDRRGQPNERERQPVQANIH